MSNDDGRSGYTEPSAGSALPARRGNRRLRREITAALVFKLCALIVLFIFFFSPQHRPDVSPETLDRVLFSSDRTEPIHD